MGYQHKKSQMEENLHSAKTKSLPSNPEDVSLKEISVDIRRKEANKPLFLTRYE
jgi:hypothetical protein